MGDELRATLARVLSEYDRLGQSQFLHWRNTTWFETPSIRQARELLARPAPDAGARVTVKTASRARLETWIEDALTYMGFDHDHDLDDAYDSLGKLPQWGTFRELVEMAKKAALDGDADDSHQVGD